MFVQTLIKAVIIGLILGLISHFIKIDQLLPNPVAYFCIGLIASLATLMLSNNSVSGSRKKRKVSPPSTPVNDGNKETGSVKWFSPRKGFGFITRENGDEIFVHFRSIASNGQRVLREGQRVAFSVSESTKGLQAEEVTTLE